MSKIKKCKDCGKKLVNYRATRCRSCAAKKRGFSKEHRRKINQTRKRLFREGKLVPWNKGKKTGPQPPALVKKRVRSRRGYRHSEETKQKIRESNKGNKHGVQNLKPFKKGECRHPETTFKKGDPRLIGENNPNWNGGASTLAQKIQATSEYKEWRGAVFKRDNYTCQVCGDDKGGNLQAHHVQPQMEMKIEYNLNTLEDVLNEERFFDVSNGVTLCKRCHKTYHDLNGYK